MSSSASKARRGGDRDRESEESVRAPTKEARVQAAGACGEYRARPSRDASEPRELERAST